MPVRNVLLPEHIHDLDGPNDPGICPPFARCHFDNQLHLFCECHRYLFGRESMKLLRRQFLHLAGAAATATLVMLCGHTAWSQPTRTIKLVVPYSPGGSIDFLARLLAEHIGRVRG